MKNVCLQINWQREFGGGEIYTGFFTRALQSLGWKVQLMVHRDASFWGRLGLRDVEIIPICDDRDIARHIHQSASGVVVTHTTLTPETAALIAGKHRLGGLLHMPLKDRDPPGLPFYHRIFPVSGYVRDTAVERGYEQALAEPLLGIADLRPRKSGTVTGILRNTEFDWDKRKLRDRLFSWFDPLLALRPRQEFKRKPGLTLGVFSRLTPIKQFPCLFSNLAPVLADFPEANLEIFGSGGYASVRDLKKSLRPVRERVRFWGHQTDPAGIYRQLDFVLSGLPEREALGLNLIEAQVAGTPVIAVGAPPFTETVVDGATGFLYADPRLDAGEDFRRLLARLLQDRTRLDPRLAKEHLQKFSAEAFQERVAIAMAELQG